ncbi:MAG: flagellar biosynthetic protein FliO [Bacteroidota bacterium]|nr:flagellar biosynthetic protein FliO [Bacteroidota bacterium]MDP4190386.1 flagellar biosynthetic protein FliO [Bacteroidota bacterium]MDP4195325.1 flagellar biosynthetic protein FliO [Bacteroidota bacterium]
MEFINILKIIFFLIILVVLMYGTLYMMKKYFYSSDKSRSKLVKIKVLSTQMIMPKKFIQVVQVHDKVLILGISDHSINLLQEFEGFIPEDRIYEEESQTAMDLKGSFKENFLEALKKNLGLK